MLVAVFRKHGETLDISVDADCGAGRAGGYPTVASLSNGGPSGVEPRADIRGVEGDLFCEVLTQLWFHTKPTVVKYATDTETYVRALNVECAVYPTNSGQRQVKRLRRAFDALVTTVGAKR